MISVTEAKTLIADNIGRCEPQTVPLLQAAGKVLAEDIYAAIDMPAFPQSSMDGYAFSFNDWKQKQTLTIEGESAAGSKPNILKQGVAVRIFTGAPVPPGADTVVMQEKTSIENGVLLIEDTLLQRSMNVRPRGSEIRSGELALPAGTILSPAATGFLAGIGITDVRVWSPSIAIIVTGNELQSPGQPLQYGQVYESNSVALLSALRELNITDVRVTHAKDNFNEIVNSLRNALEQADMVLLTGGVSVGDYDFVLEAATACGVKKILHKVKQRPGKPLFFGMKDSKPVFGLPGNPSSVLTCYYQYVLPALEKMSDQKSSLLSTTCPIAKTYRKAAGLTHFLKGHYNGNTAMPLEGQESYRMRFFAVANCLIKIEEEVTECAEGENVDIYLLTREK